jgi:uncharacterized protein YjbI with pentapeptide repeats
MHAPTKDKAGKFGKVLKAKLLAKDYDFGGVWFPGNEDFSGHIFENAVNFYSAEFSGAVNFHSAEFSGAVNFTEAEFKGDSANFNLARFSGWRTDFYSARFDCDANFDEVEFSSGNTSFNETHFNWCANFREAQFNGFFTGFQGVQVSLMANFAEARFMGHILFSEAQFKGMADFRAVEFSGGSTYFAGAVFEGEKADFSSARFAGDVQFQADFGHDADFSKAHFGGEANFGPDPLHDPEIRYFAEFKGLANFNSAVFDQDTSFKKTRFQKVSFDRAIFNGNNSFDQTLIEGDTTFCETLFGPESETSFTEVTFGPKINLEKAKIKGYVSFFGSEQNKIFYEEKNFLIMDNIRAGGKDKLLFCNVRLCPRWFVRCDPRNFIFTTIHWGWSDGFGRIRYVRKEWKDLKERHIDQRLLRIAYSYLAINAEENNRFNESSGFRKMSFEAEWLERVEQRKEWFGKLKEYLSGKSKRTLIEVLEESRIGVLQFLYRWLSGYGESWYRALLVLFLIWVGFALLYTTPLFQTAPEDKGLSLGNFSAFVYSLLVMALQKPAPLPVNSFGKLLVVLETVFAPVQLALLALAIRRKFMR